MCFGETFASVILYVIVECDRKGMDLSIELSNTRSLSSGSGLDAV